MDKTSSRKYNIKVLNIILTQADVEHIKERAKQIYVDRACMSPPECLIEATLELCVARGYINGPQK